MSDTIRIGWEFELDELRKEIKEAGTASDKEVRKLTTALKKRFKEIDSEAAKSAKAAAASWDKGLDGMKGSAERVASMMGGPFGDVADIVFDLGEKLSGTTGAIGVAGAAAGMAVAGVAALGVGTKALADYAVEAAERLREQGLAAELPEGAEASLQHYQDAGADLRRELDLLAVSLGAGVADELGDVAHATIGVIEVFGQLGDLASGVTAPLAGIRDALSWVSPLEWELWAVGKAFEFYRGAGEEAADTTQDAADAAWMATEAYAALGMAIDDETAALQHKARLIREAAEAEREAAADAAEAKRAAEKAIREETEALRKQADFRSADAKAREEAKQEEAEADNKAAEAKQKWVDMIDREIDAVESVQAGLVGLRNETDQLAESWIATTSVASASIQIWGEQLDNLLSSPAMQAIGDLAGDLAENFTAANEAEIEMLEARHEKQLAAFEAERDARRDATDEWLAGEQARIDQLLEHGVLSEAEAVTERKRLLLAAAEKKKADAEATADERAQLEARHKHQLALARKAFKENQALQRVQAVIEAARGAVALLPAYAFAGPGAPALAAATAGAGLLVALSKINSAKAPEFPMGFVPDGASPDHPRTVALQEGEPVLSRRGVAGLPRGLEDARALNEGQRLRGAGTQVLVQLGRRTLAEAWTDVNGKARPDPRRGRRDPWARK